MAERSSNRRGISSKDREILIWDYACFLLSKRIYSERELLTKLQKKYSQDTDNIEKVMKKLKYYDYLNDRKNSQIVIEQLKAKGYGPRYIYNYLTKRGFSCTNIDVKYDDRDLKKWYLKRMGNEKIRDLKTFRKMYNYLLSKGFMAEDITEFLKGWSEL